MSDYIPQAEDTLVTWLTNYKAKIKKHQAALGLSDADVKIHQDDCDKLIAAIQDAAAQKKVLANANKTKADTKNDVLGNLRTKNNSIKTLKSYTDAIGADMGIVGVATAFDTASAKPTIAVTLSGGHPVITFSKEKSNGVKIYSKRSGETTFTFLAIDTHSPYHDNRVNLAANAAEVREYYAFYIDNTDEPFGLQSDTVNVSVS